MQTQSSVRRRGNERPLERENQGTIAILTMNRPGTSNTLSEAMLAALSDELAAIGQDQSVRVLVLAANGAAFCGGHDLKELTARRSDEDGGRAYFQHILSACSTMMQQIVALPQPVIASVEGIATAAGCQLVASCDLAIASANARFGVSGINAGLFCSTPMVALSRNVGRKHAMQMLLTGDLISAEDAHRIGLVNQVVPAGEALDAARALAATIAGKSQHAVKLGKEAFYRQLGMPLGEAYGYTSEVMVENLFAADAKEGIEAFIAKRRPNWRS
ncbi:MAG: enoyl-CoA hydratase [Xanthobacteraceae bacterium]